MRVAVIGDVSGWLDAFQTAISRCGIDLDDGAWPDDLGLVQLGDQVHKGPDSADVLRYRDRLVELGGSRYVDLWGNHEAQYMGGIPFWEDAAAPRLARALLADDVRRLAVGLSLADGSKIICTHAGITRGWLSTIDASSMSARQIVQRSNALLEEGDPRVHAPGLMIQTEPSEEAGPLWAHPGYEVIPSWDDDPADFSQIVGHASLVYWARRATTYAGEADVLADFERRHAFYTFANGTWLATIDPGQTARSHDPEWQWPLFVEDVVEVWTH